MTAPAGNVLPPGTFQMEFKGQTIHGYATSLSDDIQWRIASHEIDRRAGAQTENMNRGPWQCRVTLVFVDESGFLDAQAFMLGLEINASGLFVHPIWGKRQATCSGAQGATLQATAVNTYTLPVTFSENSLDASVIGEAGQGVAAKSGAVQSLAATVLGFAATYAAAGSAVTSLATAALAFATASTASASTGAVLSPPGAAVDALSSLTATAIVALRGASTAPEVADATQDCEVLLYAAGQLAAALLAQSPALGPYVAPTDTPLIVLAQRFYGADAMDRISDIQSWNPQIVGLPFVPAGMALKMAAATV